MRTTSRSRQSTSRPPLDETSARSATGLVSSSGGGGANQLAATTPRDRTGARLKKMSRRLSASDSCRAGEGAAATAAAVGAPPRQRHQVTQRAAATSPRVRHEPPPRIGAVIAVSASEAQVKRRIETRKIAWFASSKQRPGDHRAERDPFRRAARRRAEDAGAQVRDRDRDRPQEQGRKTARTGRGAQSVAPG